ncbi:adenosylcobinamide-GDP ribazoletransferase [Pelagimonas sp. KU-00592-HH]|uniref:adenosylcobinamide-GDP ribazoletransferase n=1 Tax=Pelagimonas sp. KU-00592-HH TaxID=3127651 RepID=UPI00310689D5
MTKHDRSLIKAGDIATALALLTRLPVRAAFERGALAAWAYPLAGAALALLAAIPTALALWVGLSPLLAALVWVACHVIMTGAMHEDGLADSADGLWGGWERQRRLEIMKDSHIGSYGVITLCLSLAARWAAVGIILQSEDWLWGLIAVGVLSRAVMPALMAALPHARDTGLSHSQGRPSRETAAIAAALALALSLVCTGLGMVPLGATAFAIGLSVYAIARAKIGGQTGDILGAGQQLTEIALLMALTL